MIRNIATSILVLMASVALAAGPDPVQMMLARKKYNEGDYSGALRIYKELYAQHGTDVTLNVRMAECHLALEQPDESLPYLDRATETDSLAEPEVKFYYALAYRAKKKHQKAIEYLNRYMAQPKLGKDDVDKASELLARCRNTVDLMNNPVNVKVAPASSAINTVEYHEYHPSVTADGKLMVFTSRRPGEGKNVKVDEGDGDHFEDVYITYWSDSIGGWAPAVRAEGGINGSGHDACLSISPDGRQIFLYRNENGGDIFVSKCRLTREVKDAQAEENPNAARMHAQMKWGSPVALKSPVNSTYWDSYASLTADGRAIYFASERVGGKAQGNGDIYMSIKEGDGWGKPMNLKGINTIEDEKSVFIHPDGKTLFFSSQGHRNMGGYDIFKSVRQKDGSWSAPENLGYPINTPGDEFDFTLSTDGRTAFYCTKGENGRMDILSVDMSAYDVLSDGLLKEKGAGMMLLKGAVTNADKQGVRATLTVSENGQEVNAVQCDEDGEYFLALPGGKSYQVRITSASYKEVKQTVEVPLGADGQTRTTVQDFKMERN